VSEEGPVPTDLIKPDEEISFLNHSEDYCVCFIDMIDSTATAAKITDSAQLRTYYGIYLNSLAAISRHFGSRIVKSGGDSLVLYFPETSDPDYKEAFESVLECCLAIRDARGIINAKLREKGLPLVDYRISADYGNVEIARTKTLQNEDFFGSTMNMCAKMNSKAPRNGIVIGGDLYQILKRHSPDSHFEPKGEYSAGLRYSYPLYSVTDKNSSADLSKLFLQTLLDGPAQNPKPSPYCRKIMLIDDEPDVAAFYKLVLNNEGYHVDCFTDSKKALQHFASNPDESRHQLIVTDIRMPGINGILLYKAIKRISAGTRIIFVTALDAAQELLSIYPEIRQNDILRKPLSCDLFIQRVKDTLSG